MFRTAQSGASGSLDEVLILSLTAAKATGQARWLRVKYHYLGDIRTVGEQLLYTIPAADWIWLGQKNAYGVDIESHEDANLADCPHAQPASVFRAGFRAAFSTGEQGGRP